MASRPDAVANAALAAHVRRPINIAFLDIAGEPVRVTDGPYHLTFAGTGDEDLDGHTFQALDPSVVSVGKVRAKEGGSDTVTLTLSGLAGIDDDVMTQIGNKAAWAGRDARIWKAMLDPVQLTRIGAIWCYHTGYMSVPKITGDRTSQEISLDVESYLGFLTQASGRTYLDQSSFDAGDLSAELAIAIANSGGKPR